MSPLKILLNGTNGRMGKAILQLAPDSNISILSQVNRGDDLSRLIPQSQVVVDFSFHDATPPLAQLCAEHKKPLVIGTTGHTQEEKTTIHPIAKEIPIVWASNFSIGVNLLFYLTRKAAQKLDSYFQPEILELHHRHKKDAPSGTASSLLKIIQEARNISSDQVCYGRQGGVGERPDQEIAVHALRGGDVTGEHTVFFLGPAERLELTHKATDRKIFAQGALHAAHWVLHQPPGLYSMEDVLALK